MKKLEIIKKRVVEVFPKIMELSFGCEIKTKWNTEAVIIGKCTRFKFEEKYLYHYGKSTASYLLRNAITEIIGRPIHLADILLAYEENKTDNHSDFKRNRILLLNSWNFKDDNLKNQSSETIDFIHSLLIK